MYILYQLSEYLERIRLTTYFWQLLQSYSIGNQWACTVKMLSSTHCTVRLNEVSWRKQFSNLTKTSFCKSISTVTWTNLIHTFILLSNSHQSNQIPHNLYPLKMPPGALKFISNITTEILIDMTIHLFLIKCDRQFVKFG